MALEVPSSGASADIQLIIEGRLTELGREPHNVQVVLDECTPMVALDLQDESGTFLTVLAEDPVDSEHAGDTVESEHETSEEDDNEESVSSLKQALEEAIQQKQALADQVESLNQDLASSRARITELWKMSCAQVQEYDKIVTAKDNEIRELHSRLSDGSGSSFPEVRDASITSEETKSIGKVTREPTSPPN